MKLMEQTYSTQCKYNRYAHYTGKTTLEQKKDINTNLTNLKMQVDSRYMTTKNNTSTVSGTTTSKNEITDIWNPSDGSFAEQSDQTMKEYDERNGSQNL